MKTTRTEKLNILKTVLLSVGIAFAWRLAGAQCDPPPSGIVAWWPADGNALDIIGNNDGTLMNGATYSPGEVGQAFSFNGISAAVFVPSSASLNIGTDTGLSIECWIRPSDLAETPLVEWNSGSGIGAHFWLSAAPAPQGEQAPFLPGSLFANLVDTQGTFHIVASSGNIINTNGFQHVAVTYDGSSGIGTLYANGTVVASQSLGIFTPQTTFNFYIGNRPFGELYIRAS